MQDLSLKDNYRLRKAQMDADRKAVEAQKAQMELERLVLELEHTYGLLEEGRTLDPRSATISRSSSEPRTNGKWPAQALETSVANEAPA